jgi:uncharacterized protein (TIGR02118 family)
MVKRMYLMRRRPGLTRDEFAAHWLNVHSEIWKDVRSIRGYSINVAIDQPEWDLEAPPWDGVAEFWFDSLQSARETFAPSPLRSASLADAENFLGERQAFYVEEHVIVPRADS